jgi:Zn-dependent protease
MRLSWKLGRVAGIDLFLHPSALILFFLGIGYTNSAFENAAFVVALLGSIVLHELGHALMARKYGIQTADITLYLFGGVARLERMPRSSGPELLIALAGPAVNFAIVTILATVLGLMSLLGLPQSNLFVALLVLNLTLGLFNLLPIFPMDGGRVLRALLSGWLGRLKATEFAATLGRAFAVLGGIYFVMNGQFEGLILTIFVFMAGSMELNQVRMEGRSSTGSDGTVIVPDPPAGYRWVSGGDGVWRLAPIMVHAGGWRGRSWS